MAPDPTPNVAEPSRPAWLGTLAQAETQDLERLLDSVPESSAGEWLRRPEVGLVMLRGRMGGTGRRFNVGEATVTRCALRLQDGTIGQGWVLGRDLRKAELVARIDAHLQRNDEQAAVLRAGLEALDRAREERRAATARKAAATRVDFFTLVRGED